MESKMWSGSLRDRKKDAYINFRPCRLDSYTVPKDLRTAKFGSICQGMPPLKVNCVSTVFSTYSHDQNAFQLFIVIQPQAFHVDKKFNNFSFRRSWPKNVVSESLLFCPVHDADAPPPPSESGQSSRSSRRPRSSRSSNRRRSSRSSRETARSAPEINAPRNPNQGRQRFRFWPFASGIRSQRSPERNRYHEGQGRPRSRSRSRSAPRSRLGHSTRSAIAESRFRATRQRSRRTSRRLRGRHLSPRRQRRSPRRRCRSPRETPPSHRTHFGDPDGRCPGEGRCKTATTGNFFIKDFTLKINDKEIESYNYKDMGDTNLFDARQFSQFCNVCACNAKVIP